MKDLAKETFVDEHELALQLARNALGMQLPVEEVLDRLGIAPAELIQLSKSNNFREMVKSYRSELEKDGEGIRLKSAVALEHSIKRLYRLIHDVETPANVVVQGVKQLADMAGVSKPEVQNVATGAGFVVNIDLSGLTDTPKPQKVVIDATKE
jgi:hypothetical protein